MKYPAMAQSRGVGLAAHYGQEADALHFRGVIRSGSRSRSPSAAAELPDASMMVAVTSTFCTKTLDALAAFDAGDVHDQRYVHEFLSYGQEDGTAHDAVAVLARPSPIGWPWSDISTIRVSSQEPLGHGWSRAVRPPLSTLLDLFPCTGRGYARIRVP